MVGKRWSYVSEQKFKSLNGFGNYVINQFFNITYNTKLNDILCCLKIITKNKLKNLKLTSDGFSIESEIMAKLIINKFSIKEVQIDYKRRTVKQGKKLKMIHGWDIIYTLISIKFLNKSY